MYERASKITRKTETNNGEMVTNKIILWEKIEYIFSLYLNIFDNLK